MKKVVKLSLIMPCYNEGEHIYNNIIKTIDIVSKFENNFEIICVNDGSSDNTRKEIMIACRKNKQVKLVSYKNNQGKGNALKEGTKKATGELIAFVDSDLELSPRFIEEYINIMEKEDADVVNSIKDA